MKLLFLGFCICFTLIAENVSAQVLGGYTPVLADDNKIEQLALYSLSSVAQQSGSARSLGLIRVISAKLQVVSGNNYKMDLLVCEKVSTNNNFMDLNACRKCEVTIWEQAWLNKKSVTDVDCSNPSEIKSLLPVAENNGVPPKVIDYQMGQTLDFVTY